MGFLDHSCFSSGMVPMPDKRNANLGVNSICEHWRAGFVCNCIIKLLLG